MLTPICAGALGAQARNKPAVTATRVSSFNVFIVFTFNIHDTLVSESPAYEALLIPKSFWQ